jgi:drug/metabolite transporter (DMT)-like permease
VSGEPSDFASTTRRRLPVPALVGLTAIVMVAFAANSVLARLTLVDTATGAGTFTFIRLLAGAVVLATIARVRSSHPAARRLGGSWASAGALFVYAAAFSFAYLELATGTGALLLFGAVQLTMIGWGQVKGERLGGLAWLGVALAMGGLVWLLLPGVTAPPIGPALLMALSGAGWGAYSLRGRGSLDPTADTAGNFLRAVPMGFAALIASALTSEMGASADWEGLGYAALSGGVTSGLGYALWYGVLPSLRAASAATVQLSVPILAALGGVVLVAEPITLRLAVATAVTLGGIALVVRSR